MKSKLATIIISIIMILIILVMILLGIIFFDQIKSIDTIIEPENFQTESFDNSEVEEISIPKIINNTFGRLIEKDEEVNTIDYSYVEVDDYFYNQLDEKAKIIYRAFESNKENMKTGTYKIELGNTFSDILNTDNGKDILGQYYQSAIEAYIYDNPEIIYLSPNKMFLNIETKTVGKRVSYNVYIDNGEELNYLSDGFSSKNDVDIALERIEMVRDSILQNRTGDAYRDIKMVHDYLVDNVSYDTTISRPYIYNIYGTLINGEAVCEGYARTFKYLMDGLGINSTLVIGKATNSDGATENHAWNCVELNGSWYAIDCTWDDPVITGVGWVSPSIKYKYFLKGSTDINKDHVANGQFTEGGKIFVFPVLSNINYK